MSLLLIRQKQLFVVPYLLAATGLAVYCLYFLNNQYMWPLEVAAVIQCVVVGTLLSALWSRNHQPVKDFSLIGNKLQG
jgi:uncharacterized membrane protein YjjB (DUF3815 family)